MSELRDTASKASESAKGQWAKGRRGGLLLATSGASFMIMLDSNIVGVSLPAIARDLHVTFSAVEWVVSGYVLAFASLLMSSGALADRFGRRRLLLIGIFVFTAASFLCGMASTSLMLNLARALQGAGASIQLSAALAILGHEFRGVERARAFAFWGTVMGIAVALGPLVGGLVTSFCGWRWAFLINVPLGVVLFFLAKYSIDESKDPDARKLDFAGVVLFGSALALMVWGLISANGEGWASRSTLQKLLGSASLFIAFVFVERMQKRPMVDFSLFRNRTFLGSSFAMFGYASSAQVMMVYLPLFLQNVFGFNPALAGVGMLPFALPLFIFPRIAAVLSTRISGRALLTFGLFVVAVGNCSTAFMVSVHLPYAAVAVGMMFTGCGAGLLNGETAKVSMSVIAPERGGMASGITATVRFVGIVTAISGLGAILSSQTQRIFVQEATRNNLISAGQALDHNFVSRIVAGDLTQIVSEMSASAKISVTELCRSSFATGFTAVLLVATAIAALSGILTFLFVSATHTAVVVQLGGQSGQHTRPKEEAIVPQAD